MNYEKKYKEALENARQEYNTIENVERKQWLEEIFPELKESEDEKIRKWLIHEVTETSDKIMSYRNMNKKDVLAWLEKQGNPQKDIPRYSIGDVLCDKSCTTLNKESQPNFEITDIKNGMYICDECSFPISQQDEYELVAKRIEPKFKVGDWVISTLPGIKYPHLITDIQDGYYIFGEDDDYTHIASNDDVLKLWTIQDAKDGDVLFDGSNILLVKEVNHWHNVTSYLAYSQVYGIREYLISGSDVFTPATNEQRDLLFQKMKEAGYEWDTENKQLKKISQRMISAEAKEAMYDKLTDNDMVEALRTKYEKDRADAIAEMEKPTWSVEDMSKVQRICKYLDEAKKYYADITEIRECIDWLKSLKNRYTWKPSDGQMRALHDLNLTGNISYAGQAQTLIELYNDLLKLKA